MHCKSLFERVVPSMNRLNLAEPITDPWCKIIQTAFPSYKCLLGHPVRAHGRECNHAVDVIEPEVSGRIVVELTDDRPRPAHHHAPVQNH